MPKSVHEKNLDKTYEAFFAFCESHDRPPFAWELGKELGIAGSAAYQRVRRLHEQGRLERVPISSDKGCYVPVMQRDVRKEPMRPMPDADRRAGPKLLGMFQKLGQYVRTPSRKKRIEELEKRTAEDMKTFGDMFEKRISGIEKRLSKMDDKFERKVKKLSYELNDEAVAETIESTVNETFSRQNEQVIKNVRTWAAVVTKEVIAEELIRMNQQTMKDEVDRISKSNDVKKFV